MTKSNQLEIINMALHHQNWTVSDLAKAVLGVQNHAKMSDILLGNRILIKEDEKAIRKALGQDYDSAENIAKYQYWDKMVSNFSHLKLKDRRKTLQMPMKDIHDPIGMTHSVYNNIEFGKRKPRWDEMDGICQRLKCRPIDLTFINDRFKKPKQVVYMTWTKENGTYGDCQYVQKAIK